MQPADLHDFAESEVKDARFTRPYHRPSTKDLRSLVLALAVLARRRRLV